MVVTRRAIIVGARTASLLHLGLGLRIGKTEAADVIVDEPIPPCFELQTRYAQPNGDAYVHRSKKPRDRNKRHRRK